MNPYREHFHNELSELKSLTEDLAHHVRTALVNSITALGNSDADLAKDIIKKDQVIDDLCENIEKLSLNLLALQQPMAKDLRYIVGLLKISIDLERIGDMAVDIARGNVQLKGLVQFTGFEYIPHMAEIAEDMLSQAMSALDSDDVRLARSVAEMDSEIDELYIESRDRVLLLMIEKPEIFDYGSSFLLIDKYIERIGDHICNICESIIYMVEAKREHLN